MLQEINTRLFTLTPAASEAVRNILTERSLEGYALRVYVAGGGCCGVNFGMALDNNIELSVERLNPQLQDLSLATTRAAYKPTLSWTGNTSSSNPLIRS